MQIVDAPLDMKLDKSLNENILPYLLESGVEVEMLSSSRKLTVQCLLMYYVIEKRKLELDDIAAGKYFSCICLV